MSQSIINDENYLDQIQSKNHNQRRKMFIETEQRTNNYERRQILTNSTISSRSVQDILENTKSPTDGLPTTTYTYAQSVSYVPVMTGSNYDIPVMARRDLRNDYQNHSTNNGSMFPSPNKFASDIETNSFNGRSTIRQNPNSNDIFNSTTEKGLTSGNVDATSTISGRICRPIHSTPLDTNSARNIKLNNHDEQDATLIGSPVRSVEPREQIIRHSNKWIRWIIIPSIFIIGFLLVPQIVCKQLGKNETLKISEYCEKFDEYLPTSEKSWEILGNTKNYFNEWLIDPSRNVFGLTKNWISEKIEELSKSSSNGNGSSTSKVEQNPSISRQEQSSSLSQEKSATSDSSNLEQKLKALEKRIEDLKNSWANSSKQENNPNASENVEIKELINRLFRELIEDETGKPDFALEANGARIMDTRCTEYADEPGQAVVKFFGVPIAQMGKQPEIMIRPGRLPGQCFPFRGDQGSVIIKLATPIRPIEFVLEHLSANLSILGNISSAPKNFSVYSLNDKHDKEGKLLGNYIYDAESGRSLQSFQIQNPSNVDIEYIELRVTSNWGNPNYTCLYRFRVHAGLKKAENSP